MTDERGSRTGPDPERLKLKDGDSEEGAEEGAEEGEAAGA
jgi:hypothetical protein